MVLADPPQERPTNEEVPKAPYLMPGAPTFEMTLVNFREKYNAANPTQQIGEFRAIPDKTDSALLTRAASKINEDLYASTALEKGTGKIKSLQITYLPIKGPDEKVAHATAISYMANLIRQFDATLTPAQSQDKINYLLDKGKGMPFYQQQVGAIRYVIADNGEKGLTLAVEPVKLALSEP
ncbi:MAG: DUF1454 family protein [Rouxiella aceris]|uniref:DUF1454 family protein n=1 Tax=Rouxiella aceris TaxID=2703884 RepID=UPI00284EB513|nr:DUF1454 family protein [Rouxiella aceris]MDR3432870.1 DUF1454 family protein [Rouxiella aceris]